MAPGSHGIGKKPSGMRDGAVNGFPNYTSAPPASTLAAQLVQNIPPPAAKSSHLEDEGELPRLLGVIAHIRNEPDLLKTDQDRVEHNHVLIYVYTCAVLEGLQWDDPFAKNADLVSEASKALNFLELAITETPAVLMYTVDEKAFQSRGREPLWLWLLPRVLPMLGSGPCLSLTSTIERLCHCIFDATERDGSLWDLAPNIMLYFQTNFDLILAHLRNIALREEDEYADSDKQSFNLRLTPGPALQRTLGQLDLGSERRCSYAIRSPRQAVRHLTGLLQIVKNAGLPGRPSSESTSTPDGQGACYQNHVVWLLDSLGPLNEVLIYYQGAVDSPVMSTIEICISLIDSRCTDAFTTGVSDIVSQKMYVVLVSLCSEVAGRSPDLFAANGACRNSRYTLCSALIKLAQAATLLKPVARMIKAQLLWPLKILTMESDGLGTDADLKVGLHPFD